MQKGLFDFWKGVSEPKPDAKLQCVHCKKVFKSTQAKSSHENHCHYQNKSKKRKLNEMQSNSNNDQDTEQKVCEQTDPEQSNEDLGLHELHDSIQLKQKKKT